MDNSVDPNYYLIIAGIIAIAAEIIMGAATGFELLIVGLALIVSGGIGLAFQSVIVALGSFIVLIAAYLVMGRSMIKQSIGIATRKTNVDALIGKKALVTKPITPTQPGNISIDGEVWRATTDTDKTFAKDETITIASVSGVTVSVK